MKKGQASIEFLSTYSWAIAILVLIIGAVFYFGFIDTSAVMKSYCSVNNQWVCNDFQIYQNGVLVHLQNNFGVDMVMYNMTIYDRESNTLVTCGQMRTVYKGEKKDYYCGFDSNILSKDHKRTLEVSFAYHLLGTEPAWGTGNNMYMVRGTVYGLPHDVLLCNGALSASCDIPSNCPSLDYGILNCVGGQICCG